MSLAELVESTGLDELINILILYYLFKLGNVSLIFFKNLVETLWESYQSFKAEEVKGS